MENKTNIAELLKDCPKGTKLYSPLCGECYFDSLNMGTIICKKQNTQEISFTSEGYYMLPEFDDCERMIFPSKDQRDWSKFEPPYEFKNGDVVATTDGLWIGITKGGKNGEFIPTYCVIKPADEFEAYLERKETWVFDRLATTEGKEKLFKAIKDNGYKWNEETKTLEKLTPNKFDINTLKTFDKVLMRSSNAREWVATFYSHYSNNKFYGCGMCCDQCIPYEGNQNLLGTTNDCDKFYKNWE